MKEIKMKNTTLKDPSRGGTMTFHEMHSHQQHHRGHAGHGRHGKPKNQYHFSPKLNFH